MSQATQVKPGRYSVGQQVVGVAAIVAYPGFHPAAAHKMNLIRIPSLGLLRKNGIKVTDFVFKVLTVSEHRRVPVVHDKKRKLTCDGYILRAQDDKRADGVWHNQYPFASYEQLSDIGDSIFTFNPKAATSEEINKLFSDWKNPCQLIAAEYMLEGITMPKHEAEKILKDLNSEHPSYNCNAVAYSQQLYSQFIKAFDRDVGDHFKIIDEEVFPGYFAKRVVTK